MSLDPKARQANLKMLGHVLGPNADPDMLTPPFDTCPFSTGKGAHTRLKMRLREMEVIALRIPQKHHHVHHLQAARWYHYLRLAELLRIGIRIAASYERIEGIEFWMPPSEVPRFSIRWPYHHRIQEITKGLGDEPTEENMNRAMIQLHRLHINYESNPTLYAARVRYRKDEADTIYTERMVESGWTLDEFESTQVPFQICVSKRTEDW